MYTKKLLKDLDLTYPTLRLLIETINHDILYFGYENFSITHSSSNQLYTLNITEENSVQLIIHSYIKESPKFQLLEVLLTKSFPNIQSVADRLLISYTSIRKDILELNEILKKYSIYISTNNGVSLRGDEVGVRIYYTFLFLTVYGGEKWPFLFIRYSEITELLSYCPKEIYKESYLDKSMLVHYSVAIQLLRARKNKHIHKSYTFSVPLYKPYLEESKKLYEVFLRKLREYIPNVHEEVLRDTSEFILSTILAFGSYSFIDTVPKFFYLEPAFKKNRFLETVFLVCEKVDQHLSIPFSTKEKERLLYSLMSVNYRYLLFHNLKFDLETMILDYRNIDTNFKKKHKTKHLKLLIKQLMALDELSVFESNKKEIAADYFLILEKCIDFSKHTHPIKVAVLSVISNETSIVDFKNTFSNYYNVHVSETLMEDIDLVISDFSLSEQVLESLRMKKSIVYVNTRWNVTDYEKINSRLAEIATAKFINKVD